MTIQRWKSPVSKKTQDDLLQALVSFVLSDNRVDINNTLKKAAEHGGLDLLDTLFRTDVRPFFSVDSILEQKLPVQGDKDTQENIRELNARIRERNNRRLSAVENPVSIFSLPTLLTSPFGDGRYKSLGISLTLLSSRILADKKNLLLPEGSALLKLFNSVGRDTPVSTKTRSNALEEIQGKYALDVVSSRNCFSDKARVQSLELQTVLTQNERSSLFGGSALKAVFSYGAALESLREKELDIGYMLYEALDELHLKSPPALREERYVLE